MKRGLLVAFLCLSLVVISTQVGLAGMPEDVEQIILVLWHGLTWEDVQELHLNGPLAWGFLNTRSGGGEAVSAAYLSIGAGARAAGLTGAAAFYQGETGHQLYRRHTGLEPSFIVQPGIAEIRAVQPTDYRVEPGALGSAFAQAGVALRAIGNSDGQDPFRWSALVAMDGWGRVWQGSVGPESTILDPAYPYGVRTDYSSLLNEVLQAEEILVVVDLGDPFRYEQYQDQLLPSQNDSIRRRMVREAHLFLQDIVEQKTPRTVVLVVSPYPPRALSNRGYWLTPVLCWGAKEGLLTSGTTRWPGLITNMDVAPTILELLGVAHDQPFIGRPATVESVAQDEAESSLTTMAEKIGFLSRYRAQVLRAMVAGQILVYTAVLISLIITTSLPHRAGQILQIGLSFLLATPLVLLFWNGQHWPALLLVIGAGIFRFRSAGSLALVGFISLSTAAIISLDVLLGSWLMRYSFLGYDPVGGARFYGLGNEFMGVLIGSAVMGWAILAERTKLKERWRNGLGFFLFAAILIVIGAPSLGANAGGAISAVFGFGSTWIALANRKVSLGTALLLALATGVVLAMLMVVDGGSSRGAQSHIGQTVELLRRDGIAALWMIITRKVAMNIKLLRYSYWSNALIVALVGVGASFIWPTKFISWLKKTHPLPAKAIVGVVIGSTAAFIFNDSGVVAAATCLSFGSSTLLLLALELKHYFAPTQAYIENDSHSNQTGEHDASSRGDEG